MFSYHVPILVLILVFPLSLLTQVSGGNILLVLYRDALTKPRRLGIIY